MPDGQECTQHVNEKVTGILDAIIVQNNAAGVVGPRKCFVVQRSFANPPETNA